MYISACYNGADSAMALPEAYVTKAVQEMHRRVRAVSEAEGGYMKHD